jgi:hypothetical protein
MQCVFTIDPVSVPKQKKKAALENQGSLLCFHALASNAFASDDRIGKRSVTASAPATTAAITAASPTATSTVSASPATATTAAFSGLGFVHGEGSAAVFLAVERCDGRLGLRVTAHLDETETLATTGLPISDNFRALHAAVRAEQLLQSRAVHIVTHVSNV